MIIVGYQGVGKSTAAQHHELFIDLESSNFRIRGERFENWEQVYVNVAIDLSRQGYFVLTSSHKKILEMVMISGEKYAVVIPQPSHEVKNEWLDMLYHRYTQTNLNKDLAAYENAREQYDANIHKIVSLVPDDHLYILQDANSHLDDIIRSLITNPDL